MYSTVLFDLDGTLMDTGVGITNSAAYALKKFGIKINDRSELYQFIGPPLRYSFETFYGFSKEDTKDAVKYYRDYYNRQGIFELTIYDGILDLLQLLNKAEKTLIVATSKPEESAIKILEYFKIKKYFAYIAGSNMDGTRSDKNEVISYALEAARAADRSSAVMVGDRDYDIFGAKQVQIDSIGVLYGYGSKKELEAANADYIAERVIDIGPIVY